LLEKYALIWGGAGGSGGAVRILADRLEGAGDIDVSISTAVDVQNFLSHLARQTENSVTITEITDIVRGGAGRIRLDVNDISAFCTQGFATHNDRFYDWEVKPTVGTSDQAVLWAEAKVTPLTLGGVPLPGDPQYRPDGYNECISFASAGERELVFRTQNIPTDANIVVKVTPRQSGEKYTGTTVPATMDAGGTYVSATWRAMIPLNDARTTFQVLVSTIALYISR